MRLLKYDPNHTCGESGKFAGTRILPPEGDHLAIVESIGEAFKSKDKYHFTIELGIVGMNALISVWIECTDDGTPAENWRGLTKWNQFCAALNMKEGTYNDGAFYGSPLMITVERNGKYLNVSRMRTCSESESNKAAEWLSQHMEP